MAGKNKNATDKNIYGEPDVDDVLTGNEANNKIYGDSGNDLLQGGDGNDHLFGEDGDDTLEGGSKNDKLDGGAGNDILVGGTGNDNNLGGAGDDEIIWRAGDGNDEVDGGEGNDRFTLKTSDTEQQQVHLGLNDDGELAVTVNGDGDGHIALANIEDFNLQVGQAGASLSIGDVPEGLFGDEPVSVGGGDGDDIIDTSGSTLAVSIEAGDGDDNVISGSGDDVISGGAGDDTIDAGDGSDQVVWNAGDGNDTVDGGDGDDQVALNLDDANTTTPSTLSVQKDANGNVVLVSSDGSTLTLDQVEEVVITAAQAGTTITIGDLTGTDISQNTLYFNGGAGVDNLDASGTDRRIVANGAGGDDILRSGSGNDTLDGGAGNDILDAGSGSGVDTVLGGSGDDQISVTLGDEQGSNAIDIVDGGADTDTLNVHFTEPTPHDLFLTVASNGDGTFSVTSSDIDVDEEVRVSNVEHLVISADEPGLNFILGTLSDTSLAANGVEFQGSAGNDAFDGADTDVSLNLFGNDGDDNLIGGSAGDHLKGGAGNDSLAGEAGNDTLVGGAGNDILDGGADFDTADYSAAAVGVTVDLGNTQAQDTVGAGMDTLVNIEQVSGSAFADTLTAGSQGSTLRGNGGDDTINGGAGFDLIYGGDGNDTLVDNDGQFVGSLLSGDAGDDFIDGTTTYMNDAAGVKVNLSSTAQTMGGDNVAARSAIDGYGDTDTFGGNANNIWASQHDDHVIGSDDGQVIVTRAGDDIVEAGGGDDSIRSGSGSDSYDGGDGIDILQLFEDPFDAAGSPASGSTVDLSAGTMTDGWGNTDTVTNIENVFGSTLNDTITGDANDNGLLGHGGDDSLSGGAGNDFLWGASGNDNMDGGDGNDTIIGGTGNDTLSGGLGADAFGTNTENPDQYDFGHDTIADFDVAEDVIDIASFEEYGAVSQLNMVDDGTNTVITFEGDRSITLNNVLVADLTDANFIFGGEPPPPPASEGTEGDDILQGTEGIDVILGLGGNDRIAGMDGADTLDGGDGIDAVEYSYDPAGVTVDLAAGTATDGWGNNDILSNFENIFGSVYGDTLTGDAGNNIIIGDFNNPDGIFPPPPNQGGDDIINAGAGDDSITPGMGVDSVDGGPGFDLINFLSDPIENSVFGAGVNVTYDPGLNYNLTMENPTTGDVENHTNIEWVIGTIGGDTFIGNDSDNFFNGIVGNDYVDGGGGVDTFAASGTPEYIDLSIGEMFDDLAGGLTTTLVNVENVIGSFNDHPDVIIGNASDNILEGHLGDDTLSGGPGNDTLNGGIATLLNRGTGDPGNDWVNYNQFDNGTGVTVTLGLGGGDGSATDAFGDTDTLQSIENVQGSSYDDVITGNVEDNILYGLDGNDTLIGGDGNDALVGGAGVDIMDGGAGQDSVNFANDGINFNETGLTITFSNTDNTITSHNLTTGETEVVDNVEYVLGTFGDDIITGDDGDNFINPFFGADQVDGGAGTDTIVFSSSGGIAASLVTGTAAFNNTFLEGATFQNVENMVGSFGDDLLIGDEGDNVLEGHDGSDTLIGGAGNDTLKGGDATLVSRPNFSEEGVDTADYSQDGAGVTVNLATGLATDGSGGTDTLIEIENVVGSDFNDSLTGDDNNNELEGRGGDDTLSGGAGADQFRLTDDGNDNPVFGHDTITDFNLAEDQVNLRDFSDINDFSQISGMMTQDGADTLITFDSNNSVRLLNVNKDDLDSTHFNFVENQFIVGTEGDDQLFGDDGNDTIDALGGNDHVEGGAGNDTIDGGSGNDNLYGGDGNDTIEAGDGWDNSYGEAGDDIITDSAGGGWLVGGSGNDTLTGSANDWNELFGDEGDDVLIDPDGSGFLHGGPGNDSLDGRAVYRDDPGGVLINLDGSHGDGNSWDTGVGIVASRTAIDGWGDTDTLEAGVTRVIGSNFDDYFRGSDDISEGFEPLGGNDTFLGLGGDDRVNVGSGNDYLDGGDNWDHLKFFDNGRDAAGAQTQGIVLNLAGTSFEYESGVFANANELIDPWGDTDQVFNFESVNGTEFDDVMIGGPEHNWLEGREGNDRLFGGDVEGDNLVGHAGDDYLDGMGGDWDTAWYNEWLYEEVTDENGFTFMQQVESGPGIVADLNTGIVSDHHGGTDTLVSIENIEGSPYDDQITGDANNNWIAANQGDDDVWAGAGQDSIDGRDGDDAIYGEAGDDWLLGGQGDDLIDGGDGRDQVNYDAWTGTTSGVNIDMTNPQTVLGTVHGDLVDVFVTPDGFGGTDYLRSIEVVSGSDHDDKVIGDSADNSFWGAAGNDTLMGGDGNDYLEGGDDFDTLDGGAGRDTLWGGENDDILTGGSEGDVFRFSRFTNEGNPAAFGDDIITDYNPAEDTLDFNNVPEFTGFDALQSYASEDGNGDLVLAFTSNDYGVDESNSITLQGLTLADLPNLDIWFSPILGTDGNDTISSGADGEFIQALGGDDTVYGNGGNDHIEGGAGNDMLYGGDGEDYLRGGSGDDVIDGGADWDHVDYGGHSREFEDVWQQPFTGVEIDMNQPQQVINDGFGGSDTLISIEGISGTDHNDSFIGGPGDDHFSGHLGNDTIIGSDGNDFFHGNEGDDLLDGGNGDDFLRGGSGNDLFIFADGDTNAWDHIDDFTAGAGTDDQIDLQLVASLNSFAEVQAAASYDDPNGSYVNITDANGNVIHLQGVSYNSLHEDDFIF